MLSKLVGFVRFACSTAPFFSGSLVELSEILLFIGM